MFRVRAGRRGAREEEPQLDLVALLREPAHRASLDARALVALIRAGMVGVERPDRTLAIVFGVAEVRAVRRADTHLGAEARRSSGDHRRRVQIGDQRDLRIN